MITVACPSGMTIEARALSGEEVIIMGDQKGSSRAQAAVNAILHTVHACHLRTVEPGPYSFVVEGTGKPDMRRVLWADILFALVEIRRATFPKSRSELGFTDLYNVGDTRPMGDILDFDITCQGCKKLIEQSVDLSLLVKTRTRRILPHVAAAVSRGESLAKRLDNDVVVHWRPGTPSMDDALRDLMKREARTKETQVELVAKHATHVVDPRVKGGVKNDLRSIWRWVKKLPADDLDDLVRTIDDEQPSFDNEETITCPHEGCGVEQVIVLPFGGPPFFNPRSSPQAKRAMAAKRAAEAAARKEAETDPEMDEFSTTTAPP